jgi:hypothetical protein
MFKYQPLPPFIRGAGGIFRDVLHSSEIRYISTMTINGDYRFGKIVANATGSIITLTLEYPEQFRMLSSQMAEFMHS